MTEGTFEFEAVNRHDLEGEYIEHRLKLEGYTKSDMLHLSINRERNCYGVLPNGKKYLNRLDFDISLDQEKGLLEYLKSREAARIIKPVIHRCNDCELEVNDDAPDSSGFCQCCPRCHKNGFPCRYCGNTGEADWDGHRRCQNCNRILKHTGDCWNCYDQEGQLIKPPTLHYPGEKE